MPEPPRKSRRINARNQRLSSSTTHINTNVGNSVPQVTPTQTSTVNHVNTTSIDTAYIDQRIQQQIKAAVPELTTSIVDALKAHGLVFPQANFTTPSQTPMQSENVSYPPIPAAQSIPSTCTSIQTDNLLAGTHTNMSDNVPNTNTTVNSNIQFNSSISKPLALGVDPKIKAKIWAQEYIDIGCLISRKATKPRFQAVESEKGGMIWEKTQPPNFRFESVAHWLSAYHIFVSIYAVKYPQETGALMKYAHTIQSLARRAGDTAAFIYDRTFREWREHDWEKLPWDQVNNELYSEAMSLGLKIKFDTLSKSSVVTKSHPFPGTGAPNRSSRYCFSFNNNNGKCSRGSSCKYPHVCERCGGGHSKKDCSQSSHASKANITNYKQLKSGGTNFYPRK